MTSDDGAKHAVPDVDGLATEALLASEERYRTLFDLVPVAVYSCDAAGVIQQFNRRAAELWGRVPAIGDTDERFCGSFKLFRPDGTFMPHDQCPMAEVVAGRLAEVRDAEVLIERPDCSKITVVVNIRPLMSPDGEVAGAINCFFDISERKREEQRARKNVRLLAEADRRKSEFLAMLAHELRSPLATIHAALQVQRLAGADLPAVKRASELMERQADHLAGLVEDLLDVSRINRGKIELCRGRVELAAVVTTAVESAQSALDHMGQKLTLKMPTQPIWLNADPLRLAQVLRNLLNNACKFTESGGSIELGVALRGERAEIRVIDNGAGIDAQDLPHIFDMFMQGTTPIERSSVGLGVGLALVRRLVEMHGGTVDAYSAGPGHGSEFVVRLPVSSKVAQLPSKAPAVAASAPPIARRVLVVEDNRDAAESLAMFLRLCGHDTHVAHDGLEAVDKACELSPDVILLDIGLPKIDGWEAARRIRGQSQVRRPALVAITGWGRDVDHQKSREAGFNAHIVKPVDVGALAKLLRDLPVAGASG